MNLRCSIIGSELSGKKSLFEWVKTQPIGATLNGYTEHFWNGLTTDAFAKIVKGVIENDGFFTGWQHIVPSNQVSKHELLQLMAKRLERNDLTILPRETDRIDKTLQTIKPEHNQKLWAFAGYDGLPTIETLVSSMSVE